jgi:serine-type D-Ala-D-Ala carboxypeptidase/endopeptidase (penicillin-binding protein 4)
VRAGAVVRTVDAVGSALAASGGPPAALGAAVALAKAPATPATPAAAAATPEALAQAVRTYYALGRAGDPRNVAFLRGALRSEGDPAIRLAIAECIYLSDPESEGARRAFLEAVSPDAAALGRLWSANAGARPTPVLPSLGDLAAEGGGDALARLVELAQASAQDGGLAAAIADALAGVSASAPEELVSALRAAPGSVADAAIGALGAGLARSDDPDQPFPATLRALAQREGDAATFARALLPRLDDATRAGAASRAAPALVPAAAGSFPARAP